MSTCTHPLAGWRRDCWPIQDPDVWILLCPNLDCWTILATRIGPPPGHAPTRVEGEVPVDL